MERQSLAVQGDVTRRTDIDRLVQHSVETLGRMDVLMNNARVMRIQNMLDITEDDWDLVCTVNLTGACFVMQAVAHQMLWQGSGGGNA
jgi:NAD(P)-dependent dehydrogenase (short-subunit alcohol dehydrogenase family)